MILEIILIVVVLLLLGVVTYSANLLSVEHNTPIHKEFVGICTTAFDNTILRDRNIKKITNYLEEHGEVGNSELRKLLSVSSRTIVRYMDELEQEGIVEQVGAVGSGVVYRLRK